MGVPRYLVIVDINPQYELVMFRLVGPSGFHDSYSPTTLWSFNDTIKYFTPIPEGATEDQVRALGSLCV